MLDVLEPRWDSGCIFDEEDTGYMDNEGVDYPINLEDDGE